MGLRRIRRKVSKGITLLTAPAFTYIKGKGFYTLDELWDTKAEAEKRAKRLKEHTVVRREGGFWATYRFYRKTWSPPKKLKQERKIKGDMSLQRPW